MASIPVIPSIPVNLSSFVQITKASLPLLNLVQGQTLTITVQQKLPGNQYLMAIKDVSITATSDIPLKEGDKLQVKVQSIQPQIILSLTDTQKQSMDARVNERLVQWRLNPDSLPQLLTKSTEFSQNLRSVPLSPGFFEKDIDVLTKLLNNIVFSAKSRTNPLFVKDFVAHTGLMLEKELATLASQKASGSIPVLTDNLKASLLKLAEVLDVTPKETTKLDAAVTAKLLNLASFTSDALKTVEARQAVNVVYQQNENGLYLQIPLALGEAFRQADIFITPDDKNAEGAKKFASCAVRIFLDMDYLGELSIEAGIREGRIRCIIQCENEEVRNLIAAASGKLRETLGMVGYSVEQIDCLKTSDLAQKRAEFIRQQILGSTDLVNSFA